MEIKFLGTGSKGNCIAIQTDYSSILIDIGIPKTKVEKLLIENDINPADIDAIFLTHSHGDHVKGLPLANKWNIPVYATEGTWKSLESHEKDGRITIGNWCYYSEGLDVAAFRTHHNDYDSCGYIISLDDGEKISVCLDTGHVSPDMIEAMQGSTHIIIEANHDIDMVTMSDYPDSVKARNLSDVGHLNNDQTASVVAQLVQGNGESVYLAHLSLKCNDPALAYHAVSSALENKGFLGGIHFKLEVV